MIEKSLISGQDVVSTARDLISGAVSPLEVSMWASRINEPALNEQLRLLKKQDPALVDLLDGLGLADEKHPDGTPMYTVESYKEWLDEYLASQDAGDKK